jgi:hypothetical protein
MNLKKLIFVVASSALSLGLLARQIAHDTLVVNIGGGHRSFF